MGQQKISFDFHFPHCENCLFPLIPFAMIFEYLCVFE